MKRNPFYKTLQALALLLLALATMASAATGLDTDPDTQELYVNMPVIGLNEVEITADDIANGLTSFMVYDDGGKSGDYSNDAFGHLSLNVPTGYGVLISGTVETEVDLDKLTIYNEVISGSLSLNDENRLFFSKNVISIRFESNGSNANSGFALKVSVVKRSDVQVTIVDGGRVYLDKAEAIVGETVTLTISPADGYVYGGLEVKDASNKSVSVNISGTTATFTMPASDVTVIPTWNKLYDVTIENVTGGDVTADKNQAIAGETVTLTMVYSYGLYELGGLEVKDASNKSVSVNISGTTATFAMPSSNVTVTPTWNKLYNVTIASEAGSNVTTDKAQAIAGETVTLTISQDYGYGFGSFEVKDASHNAVAVEVSGNTATFAMPASDVTVSPTVYSVTIENVTGGNVTADKNQAIAGETVTLTISPYGGYVYGGLEVKDASNNSVSVNISGTTATFTMPASDVTVTPTWNKLYNVNIASKAGSNVTTDKAQAIAGETVTLTISQDYVYGIGSFEVKDESNNAVAVEVSGNSATFTMPASNVTVTPVNYNVKTAYVDGGEVNSDKAKAIAGETVTLTISPYGGYVYGSLEVKDDSNNSVDVEISDNTATFTMPASNVTVTPTWNKLYYVTIADKVGDNVTTDKTQTIAGETVTLTISQDYVYGFGNFEVKDASDNSVALDISGSTATFTMPASHVTVTPIEYSVNRAQATGGYVASDKDQAVAGETVSLTVSPEVGYVYGGLEVKDASDNSVAVTVTGTTATFTMPASNVTVTPTWNKLYYVTLWNDDGGKVTADKAQAIAGDIVTLSITPDDGYKLERLNVYDDLSNLVAVEITGSTATFTMPASDVTVYLPVWKKLYDVTIASVTGGEVTTDKAQAIADETVTLTISPADGYVLGSLEVKNVRTGTKIAVTVTGNTATFTMPADNVTATPAWKELYNVTISSVTGGEVIADVASAAEGSAVTLTVSPAKDYMLANLEIKDENQNVVKIAGASSFGSTVSFVMPSANVTVTPSWTKIYSAEEGLFVNMPVSGELNITIPDGITSFNVYDDGGKEGKYSFNADGYLTVTAPKGYVLLVSGTVVSGGQGQLGILRIYDGENSQATPMLSNFRNGDIGKRISSDNVVTFYFMSISPNTDHEDVGLNLKVELLKTELNLAKDGEGAYYVNMLAQNTATLNITDADIANGITSFNIYDDGGIEGNHSWSADGYLTITVPKDYVLQLTGYAKTYNSGDWSYLSVYDGNAADSPLLSAKKQGYFGDGDIGTVVSTGNVMTLYFKAQNTSAPSSTAPGLVLKATLVRRGFGAVTIAKTGDNTLRATIDGTYTGTETLSIPDEIEVDEVDYDRELEVGVPVTAMLPVALPEGTSVNADFYTLKKVEQVDDRWQATMTYIGNGKLPQPNTPYVVILPEGETKLEFNLNGKKATVQTGAIQSVCGLDKDCVLDDKGNITDDWFFTGTYAYKVWNGADEEHGIEQHPELGLAYAFAATDNPGGAAKGKFGRIVAGAHANPMRCYLRKRDANVKLVKAQQVAAASYVARYSVNYVPETIDVEFVKDDAKGGRTVLHGRMNTVTGEFKMLRDFDIKGRKVNSANRARGAYYGKKVLKK